MSFKSKIRSFKNKFSNSVENIFYDKLYGIHKPWAFKKKMSLKSLENLA
jgi:hypothetical protein